MINDGYKDYSIELAGKIKKRWELKDGERVALSATKSFGFKRVVKIKKGEDIYTLSRKPNSESIILEGPSNSVCYQRTHPLTKRHRITGQWSDDSLVIFGFWFVAYFDQIDSGLGEVVGNVLLSATH